MFGPNKNQIKSGVNPTQKQQPAASVKQSAPSKICAEHSVVKNVPVQPKKPAVKPRLVKETLVHQQSAMNAVAPRYRKPRVSDQTQIKRLAAKPVQPTMRRVRTPYLGELNATQAQRAPMAKGTAATSDLELAKSVARSMPRSRPVQNKQKPAFTETSFDAPQKRKGFRKLFSLTRAEISVFAAGVFFASGLIVLGFYMGVSRPSATAESQPETYQVQIAAGSDTATESGTTADLSEVTVEVDPGIDIEDVDWRPPMPITADMPSRLIIPKFGTNAPVRSLGLTQSGALAVPNFTNQVGWFDQSARPGEPGTVVMDGHYGIPAGSSVFGRFDELVIGDQFQIERGDGQVITYAVEEISSYPTGSVPMDRLIASDGTERLNLITCSGGWNQDQRTYDHRTVVYTKRI